MCKAINRAILNAATRAAPVVLDKCMYAVINARSRSAKAVWSVSTDMSNSICSLIISLHSLMYLELILLWHQKLNDGRRRASVTIRRVDCLSYTFMYSSNCMNLQFDSCSKMLITGYHSVTSSVLQCVPHSVLEMIKQQLSMRRASINTPTKRSTMQQHAQKRHENEQDSIVNARDFI